MSDFECVRYCFVFILHLAYWAKPTHGTSCAFGIFFVARAIPRAYVALWYEQRISSLSLPRLAAAFMLTWLCGTNYVFWNLLFALALCDTRHLFLEFSFLPWLQYREIMWPCGMNHCLHTSVFILCMFFISLLWNKNQLFRAGFRAAFRVSRSTN